HADLARPAERAEQQLLSRFHSNILLHTIAGIPAIAGGVRVLTSGELHRDAALSARMASPSRVRSASTASKRSVASSNSTASPPVAITFAGRPISARIRAISPSIIAT